LPIADLQRLRDAPIFSDCADFQQPRDAPTCSDRADLQRLPKALALFNRQSAIGNRQWGNRQWANRQ
jgi:hypothetical protein